MVNMNRRHFFKLVAGASLTPISASAVDLSQSLPLLVGDGVHNDGPAIAALFRGDPVEFGSLELAEKVLSKKGYLRLPGGAYNLGPTFEVPSGISIEGGGFRKVTVKLPYAGI